MADQEFEAARAELAAALDARMQEIGEQVFGYQPEGTHPFKTYVVDGNSRIVNIQNIVSDIGNRVFSYKPAGEDGHPFRTYVIDGNARIVRTEANVGELVEAVARIEAKLDQILSLPQAKQ